MSIQSARWLAAACVLLLGVHPAGHAQFAVIDVASIAQLVQQVQTLEQQVATARSQLTQAQARVPAITGDRGMEQLLAGTMRNYLPADWAQRSQGCAQVAAALSRRLPRHVRSAVKAQCGADAAQLARLLARGSRRSCTAARQSAALLQALSRAALANSSDRFASLQQLIDAIGSAADQKAALDLQARIAAEQGMLQNEQHEAPGALPGRAVPGVGTCPAACASWRSPDHGQFAAASAAALRALRARVDGLLRRHSGPG